MVLDQAVMNVAISQLVADFDTTVTTIQTVIALYALVMAALMLTGGKLGDLWGRRRAFSIGLVIYAIGSGLTAASWSVPSLTLGWSILEGIGAALVMPALVALVAGNSRGRTARSAYGVLGGVAGAGIAVGPILGGWATTELSWRVVFVGEVVVAAGILLGTRLIREPARESRVPEPRLGRVGARGPGPLADRDGRAAGKQLGLARPQDSPIEPLGLSLTPFVIAAGALALAAFRAWERHREAQGRDPLHPLPPVPGPEVARWALDAAGPEPDPDGDLLHHSALPADGAGARCARDRRADAPRFRRAIRGRTCGLRAGLPVRGAAAGPRRPGGSRCCRS